MVRPFSLLRRSTVVGAAIALVMLIGAAAAQADFTAIAGQQFSGVVDSPGCTTAPSGNPTIDWGDGPAGSPDVTPGKYSAGSPDAVSGSHTYAAKGTFSVTITIPDCAGAGAGPQTDFQTATVLPPVTFPQCPPVDQNSGCQFLITVTNNGNTVATDPNQGPYEGAEDALIGVVNNSSAPISHMPLSVLGVGSVRLRPGRHLQSRYRAASRRMRSAARHGGMRASGRHLLIPQAARPAGRIRRARKRARRHSERLRGADHLVLERQRGHEQRHGQLLTGAAARAIDLLQP